MIGYRGVKFDETGQNTLSATYLIQLQGKAYKSVWPEDRATAKLEWPMPGWRKVADDAGDWQSKFDEIAIACAARVS